MVRIRTENTGEEFHVGAAEQPPITYILPTIAWASLLDIIVRDAPPGAVIEVHTSDMQRVAERTLLTLDRQDISVHFTPERDHRR